MEGFPTQATKVLQQIKFFTLTLLLQPYQGTTITLCYESEETPSMKPQLRSIRTNRSPVFLSSCRRAGVSSFEMKYDIFKNEDEGT